MRSPRFSLDAIPVQYWNEVYRDCALIDAVREVAEELKKSREKVPSDFGALREARARLNEANWWNDRTVGTTVKNSELNARVNECEEAVERALADGKEGGE